MNVLTDNLMEKISILQKPEYAFALGETGTIYVASGCRGNCSGSCSGDCSGECDYDCSGTCEMDCPGRCENGCSGFCENNIL